MKKNQFFLKTGLVTLLCLSTIIFSCKKDEAESYVDGYNPTLKDAANTKYEGDYYPFATGYSWNWNGTMSLTGKMTVSAQGQSQTEPLDQNGNAYGFMNVLEKESLTLPTGTYNVFPTNETNGLQRFFEKNDTALLCRAVKQNYDSPIAEIKNPVFIKNPLITGDKWEANPSVDYSQLSNLGGSASDIKVNSKIFVLGKEDITLNGSSTPTPTVLLEQRAEVTGTINVSSSGLSGPLKMDLKIDLLLNLKKDVGLVKQTIKITGTISGSMTYAGTPVKVSMNLNMNSTLLLTNFSTNGTSAKSALVSDENKAISLENIKDQNLRKELQKILFFAQNINKAFVY